MTKDPVCGISLDTKSSHRSVHAGRIYAFCCPTCKTTFDREPGQYVGDSGAVALGPRPPAVPLATHFLSHSSIGHFLKAVLHKTAPDETRRGFR
jgi:YHS domain-containing protein